MIIEGIGDEVITVLITLLITLLVSIIWKSTNVRERPPVRAVVIRSANSETIAEIPLQPQRQPPSGNFSLKKNSLNFVYILNQHSSFPFHLTNLFLTLKTLFTF